MIFMNRRSLRPNPATLHRWRLGTARGLIACDRMVTLQKPLLDSPHCSGGRLGLGHGHTMYWQDSGPLGGLPVLLLHGGPGSASSAALIRQAAGAAGHRVIAFDQRGCGQSTPRGHTGENTTAHLVQDIESLRHHLGITRWLVVGGSWGATLALAYAARFPHAVSGLLLRGLFVPSEAQLAWFFGGAAPHFPQAWARFSRGATDTSAPGMVRWLAQVFSQGAHELQEQVTHGWLLWEQSLGGTPPLPAVSGEALAAAIDRYRIQAHFLAHACWLGQQGLLQAGARTGSIPTLFLHGRNDQVCMASAAIDVHRASNGSHWQWVDGAGHDPFHPAMVAAMTDALRSHASHADFRRQQVPA